MKKIPFEQNTKTDLTPEEIEGYKKEYGDIFQIDVEDKKCFLHKPTRQILDAALEASTKKNSKFNETIMRNCWLAGDKIIMEDDEYFMGASKVLDEVITFKSAELKKL
jgi:hypothetical protein